MFFYNKLQWENDLWMEYEWRISNAIVDCWRLCWGYKWRVLIGIHNQHQATTWAWTWKANLLTGDPFNNLLQANMNFPSNQLIQLHCNVENYVIYLLHLTHFNTTCIIKFMKHSSPQGSTASSEIIHVDHWQPHILRKRCLAPRPLEVKTASHQRVFVGLLSCMEDTWWSQTRPGGLAWDFIDIKWGYGPPWGLYFGGVTLKHKHIVELGSDQTKHADLNSIIFEPNKQTTGILPRNWFHQQQQHTGKTPRNCLDGTPKRFWAFSRQTVGGRQ